jgi:threonine/homoserine/homoserine lactone efflux protein
MTAEMLLALVGFAFATSATPGPNNTMLLASGATFGLRRTIPHMLGICAGIVVMIVAVGLGLGAVFRAVPVLYNVLQVVGIVYLLVLAWRIARSGSPKQAETRRPLGFLGAAAFQWVNPKAWVMVIAAVTAYAPEQHYLTNVLIVAGVVGAVCFVSITLWVGFGTALSRVLHRPGWMRAVNLTMAALLVLSLVPLIIDLV